MGTGEIFCRICGRGRYLSVKQWQIIVFMVLLIILTSGLFTLFSASFSVAISEKPAIHTPTSIVISSPLATATFETYKISPSLTPHLISTQKPQPTATATLQPSPTRTSRPTQTATRKPPLTLTPIPPASIICSGAPLTRLNVGMRVRVTYTDGTQGSVRSAPASGQILGKVPEGIGMIIMSGPRCDNSRVWWKVETDNGYTGWMSEGKLGEYWLEPSN